MGRRRTAAPLSEGRDKLGAIVVSDSHQDPPSLLSPTQPLISLAEELGRLLARRLRSDGNRRGYGLPELLLGAAVMALTLIFVARLLAWLPH